LVLWPAVVIRSAYSYYINCNTIWFLAVHKIFLSSNFVSSLQNVCRIMICHSVGLIDLVLNIKYTDECIIHFVPCQYTSATRLDFPVGSAAAILQIAFSLVVILLLNR